MCNAADRDANQDQADQRHDDPCQTPVVVKDEVNVVECMLRAVYSRYVTIDCDVDAEISSYLSLLRASDHKSV